MSSVLIIGLECLTQLVETNRETSPIKLGDPAFTFQSLLTQSCLAPTLPFWGLSLQFFLWLMRTHLFNRQSAGLKKVLRYEVYSDGKSLAI